MKKIHIISLFVLLFITNLWSQDYCGGDHFYDTGGSDNEYQNDESYTTVISSPNEAVVTVTFLSFSIETGYDYLTIYDGPDVNAIQLGVFTGAEIPGPFTSTHSSGSLTFKFTSDNVITRAGWDAEITCKSITCPRPENLTTLDIGNTSVNLNWNNGGSENEWEIEYGPFQFAHGDGTIISSNTKPFTINDLNQGEKMQAYVRAFCDSGTETEYSTWSEPITFVTSCGIFDAPFSEDFSYNSTPGCWFEFGNEFWNYSTDASFFAFNAGDHTPGGGTNYAYIDGSDPAGTGHISHITTPFIDVSGLTNTSVQFAVFSHNSNDATYNTLDVVLNEQNGNSTNLLHIQQSLGNNWKVYTLDVGFITDTLIQLEFIVEENSPGYSFFNDILIDDIKVDDSSVLGTNDSFLTQLIAYPNPTEDFLHINTTELLNKLIIYNTLGKKIYTKTTFNKTEFNIDFSKFSKGIYFVKMFINNQTKTLKIIKK